MFCRWAAIASYLPQRTDNDIKNYWNTYLKKKLNKQAQLQTDLDGHDQPRDHGFSSSHHSMSRGQWERRLQTDIRKAKQALSEALSPDKYSKLPDDIHHDNDDDQDLMKIKPSLSTGPCPKPEARTSSSSSTSIYASSTENIARLLKSWMRNNPSKRSGKSSSSTLTQSTSLSNVGNDSASSEGTPSATTANNNNNNNGIDLSEAFESLFGFESFESSNNSEFSQSNMSPEASLFQDESKPDLGGQLPFSLLEKWLFDESISTQGKERLSDMILDENANFF